MIVMPATSADNVNEHHAHRKSKHQAVQSGLRVVDDCVEHGTLPASLATLAGGTCRSAMEKVEVQAGRSSRDSQPTGIGPRVYHRTNRQVLHRYSSLSSNTCRVDGNSRKRRLIGLCPPRIRYPMPLSFRAISFLPTAGETFRPTAGRIVDTAAVYHHCELARYLNCSARCKGADRPVTFVSRAFRKLRPAVDAFV